MSQCKYCRAEIGWKREEGGRWIPTEGDTTTPHLCRGKEQGAKPVLQIIVGARIVGPNYTPSCGECDIPPWGVCACSSRLAA